MNVVKCYVFLLDVNICRKYISAMLYVAKQNARPPTFFVVLMAAVSSGRSFVYDRSLTVANQQADITTTFNIIVSSKLIIVWDNIYRCCNKEL